MHGKLVNTVYPSNFKSYFKGLSYIPNSFILRSHIAFTVHLPFTCAPFAQRSLLLSANPIPSSLFLAFAQSAFTVYSLFKREKTTFQGLIFT